MLPAPARRPKRSRLFRKPLAGLRRGLEKTRDTMLGRVRELVTRKAQLDARTLEELEAILVASDMGVDAAVQITDGVRRRLHSERFSAADLEAVESCIRAEVAAILGPAPTGAAERLRGNPHVILVVGVNGTGKTTSMAKLAWLYQSLGKRVLVGAADTYRAAAVEQLGIWAERAGAMLVRQKHGADPAAVAFDSVQAARARGADVVLIDTAGRLHTKRNLMEELRKIRRALEKVDATAPHETLLVLDANTGQNAVAQARDFLAAVQVTGIFLAKLDGTAKGGVVIAIKRGLELPVQFVGVGEGLEDIEEFDPLSFAEALVSRPRAQA
jgi:fused signal recognition particle receptor